MSASSSQCKVRQWTQEDFEDARARAERRQVIMERNVIRTDVMVAPFSFIDDIIWENKWQYLYNYSNPVHLRLVKDFYAYMEFVQGSENCPILHTTVHGVTIRVD